VIKEEPFSWQSNADKSLDAHGQLKMSEMEVMYGALSRIKYELEGRMKHLAGVQFPAQDDCKKTPLGVGYLVDNGWASMLALYGYARKRYENNTMQLIVIHFILSIH
jgi:hypothetical protein